MIDIDNCVCLSQSKYCLDLYLDLDYLLANPFEQNISVTNEPFDIDPMIDNITEYQKLVGKLIYVTQTRLDIAYSVHCLSQFIHKPLKFHLKVALKCLRYLKISHGKGVHIAKSNDSFLDVFVDAD